MIATSYVTPAEASELITTFGTTAETTLFGSLTQAEQQAAIMRAMLSIDRLRFKGRKEDASQTESFPRVIDGVSVGIPGEVKLAVTFQALSEASQSVDVQKMEQLKAAGVTSYSIDDFSVSLAHADSKNLSLAQRNGVCEATWRLLEPFLLIGGPLYVL